MDHSGMLRMGKSRCGGLSIIEMIIALAVAAVVLASAVPSFASFVQRSRINAATDQLFVSLNLARNEALKRRSAVTVCPSANGTACDTSDIDWSAGWRVEDSAGNMIRRVDATSIHASIDIEVDNEVQAGVVFNPTGDALGTNGEFRVCHTDSTVDSRSVEVSAAGRVEAHDRDVADCDA